jgi:TPP-dependent pyruvate/acetoin dehydrogenase alpha subunit
MARPAGKRSRKKPELDYAALSAHPIPLVEGEPADEINSSLALPADEAAVMIEMLRRMAPIRAFEQRLAREVAAGTIPAALHLSIGQEACAVGACLRYSLAITTTTHRSHGHMIARGAGLEEMAAELFGKAVGCVAGWAARCTSPTRLGALGANGIVGASSVIAVGAAHSPRCAGHRRWRSAFMGDGATAQGMFHEALSFAAVFNLPPSVHRKQPVCRVHPRPRPHAPPASCRPGAGLWRARCDGRWE